MAGDATKKSSAGKKIQGLQTTLPGTKSRKAMRIGYVRKDGTWSGRRRMVKI
jgi:hypothetical protein